MSGICPCTVGNSVSKALFGLRDAKKLNCEEPEQTASASLISKRVAHSNTMYHESPWQYLLKFQLENNSELELQVSEDHYGKWKEGSTGTLVWQGEKLISFQ